MRSMIKKSIILILGILLLNINLSSAIQENNPSAFLQITDIYTFEQDGHFERNSVVLLTHNDQYDKILTLLDHTMQVLRILSDHINICN